MFDGRQHCIGCAEIRCVVAALKTAYARGRHHSAEIRILARALDYASPPWIAGNVDHRCKGPHQAMRGCLDRGLSRRKFSPRGVEARGFGDRNREDRPEAVYDIVCKEERDPEARLDD